jgi:hypothetical protein
MAPSPERNQRFIACKDQEACRVEPSCARDAEGRYAALESSNGLAALGTPTQSSHHSALATRGGPQSCVHAEEYGSGPSGAALFSRAACTAQFSSTYRIACNASRGETSRCAW